MSLQAASPALVLASGSASRRTLLAAVGLDFEALAADVDEAAIKREAPAGRWDAAATALALADAKARAIEALRPDALVIGADQLLVCEGRWFDKPATPEQAKKDLKLLRGRTHTLVTAVVCRHGGEEVWQVVASPRLTMRAFSDAFLDAYVAAEGPALTTTVGAYRLEGRGAQLFANVEGEYAAVLGLPLLDLLAFLRRSGVLTA